MEDDRKSVKVSWTRGNLHPPRQQCFSRQIEITYHLSEANDTEEVNAHFPHLPNFFLSVPPNISTKQVLQQTEEEGL